MKIFYVPSSNEGRSYKLIKQGLLNHPNIELTIDHKESDYIFYHSQAIPNLKFNKNKLIYIDFEDTQKFRNIDCLAYFKRSWCITKNHKRISAEFPNNFHPISYAIMDEFIYKKLNYNKKQINLGCYLRTTNEPYKQMVLNIVHGLNKNKLIYIKTGEINQSKRNVFDNEYLGTLQNTQILVTCNPSRWEGDSRTWEGLANGCLVFVDRMATPLLCPLEDEKHVVLYDLNKLNILEDKIKYYLNHGEEAERIANEGYDYAMKYHKTVDRIKYILDKIKVT